MNKYIPLSGLATNPSDFDAPDGQLGTCLNLIPEDEALHTISLNNTTSFQIGTTSCSLLYKHTGSEFTNYIIQCQLAAHQYNYYYLKASNLSDAKTQITEIPTSFEVNSVSSIGTILVLMGDDTTYYLFWTGSEYEIVQDFTYDIHLGLHDGEVELTSSDEIILEHGVVTINYTDADQFVGTISSAESREIYNRLVANLNKKIDESDDAKYVFRGVSFGVAALRLYDNSYIAISDPFILGGLDRDRLELTKLVRNALGDQLTHTLTSQMHTGKYDIKVTMNSYMKRIINGVDIFVSLPIETWDVDKSYTVTASPGQHYSDPFSLPYQKLSDGDVYKRFDNLSFFKSMEMTLGDDGNTEVKPIEKVFGTEESISLADFRRTRMSAKTSYNYNNRLHIAGTKTDYSAVMDSKIHYEIDTQQYESVEHTNFLSGDVFGANEFHADDEFRMLDCKAIVQFSDDTAIYYEGSVVWPLPPIVSFPDRKANSIELYVYDPDANQQEQYIKIQIPLHSSVNFGLAYRLKTSARGTENTKEFFFNISSEDIITYITESEYNSIDHHYYVSNYRSPDRTNNILRYSVAENPFVFPVLNYAVVGNAEILGLATSTQPISVGQHGVAPLYVFTTEATWALTVGNDGTYDARQPATRDVLVSPSSITPIDTAVVFATARGIMLIQGTTSVCLTETLDGAPFVYASSLPASATSLLTATRNTYDDVHDVYTQTTIPAPPLSYQQFKSVFLPDCKIFYDYAAQKLVIFNPKGSPAMPYAYVYSFRSKQWGVCECDYKDVIATYPTQIAVIQKEENNVLYNYAVDGFVVDGSRQEVLFCTRPLKLDAPFDFKTIRSLVVRGNFYPHTKLSIVIYGSNDLLHWQQVSSSYNHIIRGRLGNPWKYFRVVVIGELHEHQSISGLHVDFFSRWQNQIR